MKRKKTRRKLHRQTQAAPAILADSKYNRIDNKHNNPNKQNILTWFAPTHLIRNAWAQVAREHSSRIHTALLLSSVVVVVVVIIIIDEHK